MSEWSNFENLNTGLASSKERRRALGQDTLPTGIPFLDQCCEGIQKNDLILVCAPSGTGKSQVAINIAMANRDKKVAVFFLEGYTPELADRCLYERLTDRFFKDPERVRTNINYFDWILGKIDNAFEKYYDEEIKKLDDETKSLTIRYRGVDGYSILDFQREIANLKGFDLIIVDHFHYFDTDPQGQETAEHRKIIKTIRDLSLLYSVPVVVMAHLRKRDLNSKKRSPVADLDDILGTSDIYKNATKVIMIAPGPPFIAPSSMNCSSNCWTTYFRIAKCRLDGSRTKYIAKTVFDAAKNSYMDNFKLGDFNSDGEWIDIEPFRLPDWAKDK